MRLEKGSEEIKVSPAGGPHGKHPDKRGPEV